MTMNECRELIDNGVWNFRNLFSNFKSDSSVFRLENVSRNSRRRPVVRIYRSLVQVVRFRIVADGRNLFGQRHEAWKLTRTDLSVAETSELKQTKEMNFIRLSLNLIYRPLNSIIKFTMFITKEIESDKNIITGRGRRFQNFSIEGNHK